MNLDDREREAERGKQQEPQLNADERPPLSRLTRAALIFAGLSWIVLPVIGGVVAMVLGAVSVFRAETTEHDETDQLRQRKAAYAAIGIGGANVFMCVFGVLAFLGGLQWLMETVSKIQ